VKASFATPSGASRIVTNLSDGTAFATTSRSVSRFAQSFPYILKNRNLTLTSLCTQFLYPSSVAANVLQLPPRFQLMISTSYSNPSKVLGNNLTKNILREGLCDFPLRPLLEHYFSPLVAVVEISTTVSCFDALLRVV
jgi:hypothetical protein